MGRRGKEQKLAALLIAALLAGSFLLLSPVWERHREGEKEMGLIGQARQAAAEGAGELAEGEDLPGDAAGQGAPLKETEGQGEPLGRVHTALQKQFWEQEEEPEIPENHEEMAGIGILTIPKIEAQLPVTAGVSEEQLKVSEGWVTQSSPVGSKGNAVVAGHRSYTYGKHFNRLGELGIGDEILYADAEGVEMKFLVSEVRVVEPEDAEVFAPAPEGAAWLTLYTCTPVRTASHRLIVRAERVE